jgi:hypothetical protein
MMKIANNKLIHNALTSWVTDLPIHLTGDRLGFYWVSVEIQPGWEFYLQTALATGAHK